MTKIPQALAIAMVAATLATGVSAQNADVEDFYRDNTVRLLVGYSAGGGYDTYARTLARYMSEHIPGNPTIVVQNVPGAGSLVLTNQIANTLENDGTVFATVARGAAFEPLFGNEQALYNPEEMSWIGSLNNEVGLCAAWHTSGIETWEDLKDNELVVGGTGAGADTDTFPSVLSEALGLNFNLVSGYPGSSEINLAMERGEVEGHCTGGYTGVQQSWGPWIEDGLLTPLFQLSLAKSSAVPDAPLVTEAAETDYQAQVLNLLFARQVLGRPYVAPPGVPAERLAALREAFEATAADPDFLAEARNQNLSIQYVGPDTITDVIRRSYESPREVVELIQNAQ